jgi:putative SOS response-associated peptidase YedK
MPELDRFASHLRSEREDPKDGRKPINAKCETVATLPTFRDAYRRRRCIVPVDGFFEWKAIKGQKAKRPYAIAIKDGTPFGIGGIWENWKEPSSGEWIRTFAIITTDVNELVAEIHDRMPLILASGYSLAERRAGPARPDATVLSRADADVADLHARQQVQE